LKSEANFCEGENESGKAIGKIGESLDEVREEAL
jgi:hypothetical protein